jgi:hypothetical protein
VNLSVTCTYPPCLPEPVTECPGTSWNVLEHHGMLWNIMECYGMLWNVMELARTGCVLLTADKC